MSPLLALVPFVVGVAVAQDETIALRIAIDDREVGRLVRPVVRMDLPGNVFEVQFTDDGSVDGDVARDHIFLARVDAPRRETLSFAIHDGDTQLKAFKVALPAGDAADFAYKTVAGPEVLVRDLKAPPIPDSNRRPLEEEADAGAGDRMTLHVKVDDMALRRLQQPTVGLAVDGAAAFDLLDDGSITDDTPQDGAYRADIEKVKVFLPSTGEADVDLRTLDGDEGIELKREPTAADANDGASGAGPEGATGASSAAAARFVHVLWLAIALFAMGFAYVRSVVATRWESEVRPLLRRMERFLDQAEGRSEDSDG
jgi:hypothetical protein